jgi:hypothetical protein
VGEVAALAAVAVDDDRLACLDLAAEVLQGKVGALAGTPDNPLFPFPDRLPSVFSALGEKANS